jgi:hypothetical protein
VAGLSAGSPERPAEAALRAWQQDCAAAVRRLSGGSKSHWLARAYGEAFLVRSAPDRVVAEVPPDQIVRRLMSVLEQAAAALSGPSAPTSPGATPAPRRFGFVHDAALRPVLEQAYLDSRRALEEGRFEEALATTCGILEAVVTDALEQAGPAGRAPHGPPPGRVTDWTFEDRLSVAERSGLIRGGCARLPPVARRYRELSDEQGALRPEARVSELEARRTAQVLQVVLRDLDPGR